MIKRMPRFDPDAPVAVIEIGNTTTTVATWHDEVLKTPLSFPTANLAAFGEAFDAHLKAAPGNGLGAAVIGSVVPLALERIRAQVLAAFDKEALVVGETIPLPIDVGVTDARAIGVDRVCEAAAAYETLKTACTVVDFGTAVTADLVDDEGTLVGGAILPGCELQLRALHEYTAALPKVDPGVPELPYGRNTAEAIQTGVCRGLAGAVRGLVEGYATYLNRWPQVVATGGDAPLLQPYCDFIDTFTANLPLRGIGLAYTKHLVDMGA